MKDVDYEMMEVEEEDMHYIKEDIKRLTLWTDLNCCKIKVVNGAFSSLAFFLAVNTLHISFFPLFCSVCLCAFFLLPPDFTALLCRWFVIYVSRS